MRTKSITPSVLEFDNGFPVVHLPEYQGTKHEIKTVKRLMGKGTDNVKTAKNSYRTAMLSLAPHKQAGIGNLCPGASLGCAAACLDSTGLGAVFPAIRAARVSKSVCFQLVREWFVDTLKRELTNKSASAERSGEKLAVRLNVFSDIRWEEYIDMSEFSNVEFYDYTKLSNRKTGPNYRLTFSRSESNESECIKVLESGNNVSVVFHDNLKPSVGNRAKLQRLPKTWNGFKVIDGDVTDARFDDPVGVVVGLRLKSPNWHQHNEAVASGFSVPTFA